METQYDQDHFQFNYPDGIENNYWNFARNKIILNTIKKYPVGNIVDVGAGRGIVTGYLHNHGISIRGFELGTTTPISNSNAPVIYNTDVLSIPKSDAKANYNAVSFFDVIEHIENPVSFMKSILSHFENAEYLIIAVPSRKELWSNFDDYYGHFRRYNLHDLRNEVTQVGFEVLTCRYFFHSLYFAILLNNLIAKKRTIAFKPPTGIFKTINAFLGTIFYLEKFIVPGSWYGSSIICVARRKKG